MTKSQGFSLVEVLVALTIFSVVLLGSGVASLQSLRFTREAYYHSYALLHSKSLANYIQLCLHAKSRGIQCHLQQGTQDILKAIEKLPNAKVTISSHDKNAQVLVQWTNHINNKINQLKLHVTAKGFNFIESS